jgi:hypothetical protein
VVLPALAPKAEVPNPDVVGGATADDPKPDVAG